MKDKARVKAVKETIEYWEREVKTAPAHIKPAIWANIEGLKASIK